MSVSNNILSQFIISLFKSEFFLFFSIILLSSEAIFKKTSSNVGIDTL